MAGPRLLTTQEVVDLIEAETGSTITPATFRSYAARGQAPAPVQRRANCPFYSRKQILEWIHNRPGSGARTDVTKPRARGADRATRTEPSTTPTPNSPDADAAVATPPTTATTPAVRPARRTRTSPKRDTSAAKPREQ